VDIRKQSGGPLANIHKIRSLNPTVLEVQLALYRVLMFGPSELSRAQRELIATVVSATNHCPY
jgi:alkylhydroperoxidase family enzyme